MSNTLANGAVNTSYAFDPQSLEIKTKSVEQTLIPLVTQVEVYLLYYHLLTSQNSFYHYPLIHKVLKDFPVTFPFTSSLSGYIYKIQSS